MLEERCRSPETLQRDLKRARIVLLAAAGRSTRSIAKEVGVQPRIVSLWRHRYADDGLEGLQSKPLPGKQPIYTKATDKRILKLLDKPPPAGYARWTGPLLAGELGDVHMQYVWRFLRSNKIDLAARKSWYESNDPQFTAKAADVVSLYVAPPRKAIVLCVDEKPSIQALERAQGYLKLPNGRSLTGQSHDYKRHGTTTLFAALEVATGKILATHSKRRRRVEFLSFMDRVTVENGRRLVETPPPIIQSARILVRSPVSHEVSGFLDLLLTLHGDGAHGFARPCPLRGWVFLVACDGDQRLPAGLTCALERH